MKCLNFRVVVRPNSQCVCQPEHMEAVRMSANDIVAVLLPWAFRVRGDPSLPAHCHLLSSLGCPLARFLVAESYQRGSTAALETWCWQVCGVWQPEEGRSLGSRMSSCGTSWVGVLGGLLAMFICLLHAGQWTLRNHLWGTSVCFNSLLSAYFVFLS